MNDTHGATGQGWIGVDLDGTLAVYDKWVGWWHIGEPVPKMLERVKLWLSIGTRVKIMTARVHPGKEDADACREAIRQWLEKHGLGDLEGTHEKRSPHARALG